MEKTISTINALFVQWHNDIVEAAQKLSTETAQEEAASADSPASDSNVGLGAAAAKTDVTA